MGNQACCTPAEEAPGVIVAQVSSEAPPPPEKPQEMQPEPAAPEPAPAVPEAPAKVAPPPPPPVEEKPAQLELFFKVANGSTKSVVFIEKPLGIDFNRSLPITVKCCKPGSFAETLGVTKGWELTKANETEIGGKSAAEVKEILVNFAETLPQRSN